MNVITTEKIPASVPKKQRARLLKMQREKVKRQLSQYFLAWEPQAMDSVTAYDKNVNRCGMTESFVSLVRKMEFKWHIHCYVIGREKNGKHRLDGFTYDVKTPCSHEDIKSAVSDVHYEFIADYKDSIHADNFISAGWIATLQSDIDDDFALAIFTDAGTFELLADWEEA